MNSGHVVAWPSLTASLFVGAENAWAVYRRNVGEGNALSKTPHAAINSLAAAVRPSMNVGYVWNSLQQSLSISARLYSALRIISAAILVFISSVDSLANFNNKITKISRIYAHPNKEQNFQIFHQFLCREMARSRKRKETPSPWFVLVWSSLSVGLHQALAQLQLFYFGAGYVTRKIY